MGCSSGLTRQFSFNCSVTKMEIWPVKVIYARRKEGEAVKRLRVGGQFKFNPQPTSVPFREGSLGCHGGSVVKRTCCSCQDSGHTFDPNTQEAEAGRPTSLRSAWSTRWVPRTVRATRGNSVLKKSRKRQQQKKKKIQFIIRKQNRCREETENAVKILTNRAKTQHPGTDSKQQRLKLITQKRFMHPSKNHPTPD